MILERIKGPADVKCLSLAEMKTLAAEMRDALLHKLSVCGGHFGPNFGMVEATIALHYVFNSPEDKIVFDVSHQSYPHKMLTGRAEAYLYPEKYGEVSGYSEPEESAHDHFVIGHTSTSVSLASGLAKGRDLLGGRENVIAVIGDGSLSGGEAFEGLDFAGGELHTNFIVIVNDNQMSIAENHGGLYKSLQELRETNGTGPNNYFKTLGLDYLYVADGNDLEQLIAAFRQVKDIDHPIVVHINTLKGKGYKPAEEHKENYHWTMPFNIETGEPSVRFEGEDYGDLTAHHLMDLMKEDERVVAITAGTPTVMGFTADRRAAVGKQFVDVGIAEEQAVAMASGIAKAGASPVFGVYSTFIQRTYDQLSQDLCINNNPATLLVFWGSLSAMNDVTHLCFFDIPLLCNIPNLVYLAPTSAEEYFAMMDWSVRQQEHPVAIRVPASCGVRHTTETVDTDYSTLNRYRMTHQGSRVAILGLGSFYWLGEEVHRELAAEGIDATLINPRYITGIDEQMMQQLKQDHELVVTLEDGVLDGGFGEKIARFYGTTSMKVLNFGAKKAFVDRYDVPTFLKENHLTKGQIAEDILKLL